jgi:tryptophan synthase alpha chain
MTNPRDRLGAAIAAASKKGEPALVAFLTAGHPRREAFREHLAAIASAADVVEVGVPFSDPMADGVTIQGSSRAALEQGVTLRWILAALTAMPRVQAPLVLMSYLNPLLAFGYDALAESANRAGVCGFIVPDLPFDEGDDLRASLSGQGLALVQMVTPVTTPDRLRAVCARSEGFVYAVTSTGTTGRRAELPEDLRAYLGAVRAASRVPVCAGFGIRTREHVALLRGQVDGVIVGSALVEVLDSGADPAAFLRGLRTGGA